MQGELWKRARDEAGKSLSDVEHELRLRTPNRWPSRATIARFEQDRARLDLVIMAHIAEIYGKSVRDIDPAALEDMREGGDVLLRASRWRKVFAGSAA